MKIKGFRWVIIGLIFLATVINYIDRSTLSIMWGQEPVQFVTVPYLEGAKTAKVQEIQVAAGDAVVGTDKEAGTQGTALFVLDADGTPINVVSKLEGSINELSVAVGDEVSKNQIIATVNVNIKAEQRGIAADLGLTKSDYGLINSIFLVAYALGQLLSGKIFDRIGTRIGYVLAIGVWGVSSFLHSITRGFASLAFFRVTLGFAEAGNWPGAVKSNAEWFPVHERAVAQGLFNAGASIGSVIAPPLIATLFIAFGWKVAFMVVGSFGVCWIIPWIIINKAGPKQHPWVSDEERQYIIDGQPAEAPLADGAEEKGLSWGQMLRIKETYSVLVGRFFLEPVWWFFVIWMPIYLFDVYKLDVKGVGMFAWFPYVGAALGSIVGGIVSGKIISKTGSIDKGRKITVVIGAVIMIAGLIAALSFEHTPYSFVVVVFCVLFGFQFAIGNIQTLPGDFYSGKSVGSLAGMGGMVGVFSVIILNFIASYLAETSNYTPAFFLIGIMVPLGVISVFFFGGKIGPVDKARIAKVQGNA